VYFHPMAANSGSMFGSCLRGAGREGGREGGREYRDM
jgi:hypothetical protein